VASSKLDWSRWFNVIAAAIELILWWTADQAALVAWSISFSHLREILAPRQSQAGGALFMSGRQKAVISFCFLIWTSFYESLRWSNTVSLTGFGPHHCFFMRSGWT
jgi:hypothetical protein